MKICKRLFYFLNALLLLLPLQLFAAEESTAAAIKSAASLNTDSLNSDPMSGDYLMQLVMGLFVVLLCIVVLAWFAKKMNRFNSLADGSLKVIGGISMGSRERVVLLQVGEEQLLLGVSPGKINTLHVLASPLKVTGAQTDNTTGDSFLDKLKTTMADASKASINTQNK